jgi:hypothetical protein
VLTSIAKLKAISGKSGRYTQEGRQTDLNLAHRERRFVDDRANVPSGRCPAVHSDLQGNPIHGLERGGDRHACYGTGQAAGRPSRRSTRLECCRECDQRRAE